ncbi:MAG: serine hydroxymethyltransferase [bacterium]
MLAPHDSNISSILQKELERQRNGLELIPSENFVSLAVLQALGSVLTNKYAEGYPGNRYYGGTEHVDAIEELAIARAKQLFGAEHVNVQPLSGAPANIAVYSALMEPGETILGMNLSHGGHLTHGHPVTWMAKLFNFIRYKTTSDGRIDFDEVRQLARQHKPKIILAGYSAYSREIDYKQFKEIADDVGAMTMADIAHTAGLISAGEMKNPVPIFDVVTTTTHKTLRGPRGGMILCREEFAKKIDKAVFPGFQGGPHQHNIAAKAVAFFEALQPEFKDYARQIKKNAVALCDVLQKGGMNIMFGGTENHLILADVTPFGLTGREAQVLLDSVRITLNKNMIPDDPRKPMDPSGIRLGTPALTTRGMEEDDMRVIGTTIIDLLKHPKEDSVKQRAEKTVKELTERYPLYPGLSYT